jgi:hypothetical protein
MKMLKLAAAIACALTVVACSSTQENYYAAVEKAAIANAEMHRAKMEALAAMAAKGDAAAQGAAVMAMALTNAPVVVPQYVESESLSWAKVLAMPVATVAGLAIQADVAKNASDNAASVQMATMQSQENIQLGQQGMLVDALGVSGAGSQAAVDGLVTLGAAGFTALNTAGQQTVDVATVGLATSENVAIAGLSTTENVAVAGLSTTENVAVAGLNATETVSLGAQTSLVTLGTVGIDAVATVGTVGIDAVGTVGTTGMTNLVDLGTTSLNTIETITQESNATITTITSDYNTLLNNYNATMESIATDNPDVCVVDPVTGTVTCN